MKRIDGIYPLFDSIPVSLAICNNAGLILDINKHFCKLFGIKKEDIVDKKLPETGIFYTEQSDAILKSLSDKKNTLQDLEITYQAKNKIIKQAHLSVNPINLEDNSYFIITINDIIEKRESELKQAQNALIESENRFRIITELSPDILTIVNQTGEILYTSRTENKFGGFSKEDLLHTSVFDMVHPDDLDNIKIQIREILEIEGHIGRMRYRQKTKLGGYIWVDTFGINLSEYPEIGTALMVTRDVAQQKESEELLLETNHFLQTLLNSIPVMTCWKDVHSVYQGGNDLFLKLVNLSSESELIGKTDKDLFGELQSAAFTEFDLEVITSGNAKKFYEDRHINTNGQEGWIMKSKTPLKNKEGKVIGILVTGQDITERKEMEIALQRSESKYRSLFENMTSAFALQEMIYDENGHPFDYRYLEINPAFERLTGIPSSVLLGKTVKEILPGTEQYWVDIFGKVAQTGMPYYYENYSKELGKWYDTYSFSPKENHFAVVFNDSTARKMAEEALEAREKRLRNLIEQSPTAIIEWTKEFHILEWNPAAENIFGYRKEEVSGTMLFENILTEKEKIRVNQLISNLPDSFQPNKFTLENVNRLGELMICEWNNRLLMDEKGEFFGILSMIEDITERRRAEENMNRKNEELTKINKELDKFVYSASHDLRAPITSLLGLIEIAKMEESKEKIFLYLDRQKKSLKKMDEFIHEIVNYSRNGRLSLSKEQIDLETIVLDLFEQYNYLEKALLVKKQLTIHQNALFFSDKQRISIVLSNLISNSLKYVDTNKPHSFLNIEISIDTENAIVSILDNGEGIHPDYIDKIYDMFVRASPNSTGSGIGLYIVKEVMEKLEGTIDVESDWGNWTKFTVTFPNMKNLQIV